jgi:hypothetical protein
MSADAKLRGRPAAHRLHVTAALLALSAGSAIGETQINAFSSDLVQIADATGNGYTAFSVDAIKGVAGQEIPIRVNMPSPADLTTGEALQAFILVRNIPAGVRLTTGMANGRLWVLSLNDLDDLRLVAQPGNAGNFTLEFNLIGANNRKLAQQSVPVELVDPGTPRQLQTTATGALAALEEAPLEPPPARPARSGQKMPPKEEAVLLEKGRELIRQGGITAARIIFEELAKKGSAQGALDLARSYDPMYTPDPRLASVAPDVNKALQWYRRADELGSEEARARLAEIASTR